ncbi:MAG TPA: hypothetical protein VGT61_15845 [Thermomicrobiales bacterium]|jgi:hypothetical protein|nr:hypothetical protein [Thermomicrobiales bacterium]
MAGTGPVEEHVPHPVDSADLSSWFVFIDHIPSEIINGRDGITDEQGYEAFLRGWVDDVQEAVAITGQFPDGTTVDQRGYQIGPAAGPFWDVIFYLKDHGNDVIQNAGAYIEIAKTTIEVFRLRKRRLLENGRGEDEANYQLGTVTLTEVMVEALCMNHAHSSFYDPAKHPALRKVTNTHGSLSGWREHPSPSTRYSVAIGVGRVTYVYSCQANGKVDSLLRIEDGNTTTLENPDLTGFHSEVPPALG